MKELESWEQYDNIAIMTSKYTINEIRRGESPVPPAIGEASMLITDAGRRESRPELINWIQENIESIMETPSGTHGNITGFKQADDKTFKAMFNDGTEITMKPVRGVNNVIHAFIFTWTDENNKEQDMELEMPRDILNTISYESDDAGRFTDDMDVLINQLNDAINIKKID